MSEEILEKYYRNCRKTNGNFGEIFGKNLEQPKDVEDILEKFQRNFKKI